MLILNLVRGLVNPPTTISRLQFGSLLLKSLIIVYIKVKEFILLNLIQKYTKKIKVNLKPTQKTLIDKLNNLKKELLLSSQFIVIYTNISQVLSIIPNRYQRQITGFNPVSIHH